MMELGTIPQTRMVGNAILLQRNKDLGFNIQTNGFKLQMGEVSSIPT